MSRSIKSATITKTQWTIGNKKLQVGSLHGERFRQWYNQEFNLSGLDNKE